MLFAIIFDLFNFPPELTHFYCLFRRHPHWPYWLPYGTYGHTAILCKNENKAYRYKASTMANMGVYGTSNSWEE